MSLQGPQPHDCLLALCSRHRKKHEAGSRVSQPVHQHSALNDSGFFQKSEPLLKNEDLPAVRIFKESASGSENNSKRNLKILLSKSNIVGKSVQHPQGDALKDKNSLGYVNSSSILFLFFFFFYLSHYSLQVPDQIPHERIRPELENQIPSGRRHKYLKLSGNMITGTCGDHREKTLPARLKHPRLTVFKTVCWAMISSRTRFGHSLPFYRQ